VKILIYSLNYAPEAVGIGKYSGEMAAWLAAQGHAVRVVSAPPYYPQWKLQEGYARPAYRCERMDGVEVWRAPLWVPGSQGGLKRILHQLTFALSSLPLMLRQIVWRPDVVLTVAPGLVCAPTGWLVARLSGATAWLHIQDFEVDVAFQMGLLKGALARRIALGVERWLLNRFDVVSSISNAMVRRLKRKGVPEGRVELFPNWVDMQHIAPLERESSYRAELGLALNARVALFSGTLGNKQGLMVIPEAAALLQERHDIVFVVCGDGAMKPQLVEAAKTLPNLVLLPLQPFARLNELLGLAAIHLLPQSVDAEDLVLPSKLGGMLASGRPVIATCRPGTELEMVVSQCGETVMPGDARALADAIVNLMDDAPRRTIIGELARCYAMQNLERDAVLRTLLMRMSPGDR